LSVIWIGLYTKYLTERAQRKAFLETRLEFDFEICQASDIKKHEHLKKSFEQKDF